MAQHFLLSSEARTFSIVKIAKMTEKQAESYLEKYVGLKLTVNLFVLIVVL
ncbi:hypothetical protein [Aliarcobacter butzleri]|uniref:hypothetical protein n=1 Tax=Aliarcobacter butzleri TaxID=28197 RepID=UPI00263ED2AD|nr:hypothetical protein [Aliarcobacter butzleri]MDN5095173.1 hypothetical protein [Aliarcobacter butzleri]